MIFLDVQSSKTQTYQMLANPQKPWLYIRGIRTVQVWAPSRERLIPTCPIGQRLVANEEHYEQEDEWDTTNPFPFGDYSKLFRRGVFKEEEDITEEAAPCDDVIGLPGEW